MKTEVITLHEERNVTLTCYLQDANDDFLLGINKRPAVLVLPGGGYEYCSPREADPVAFPYLKAGCHVFILRYSVQKNAVWPTPLNDYEEAMVMIREKSEEWKVWPDKIAVIGFSAGGHLAAAAATMAKNRPNAVILGYAALEGFKVRSLDNAHMPSMIDRIDDLTPPCFLFHTRTDGLAPVTHSINFMRALTEHNISFECHIYAYGPHGFSTSDSSVQSAKVAITPRTRDWVEDSISWLCEVLGEFENGAMGEPKIKSHVNDDYLPYLTVDCTLGHIMKNKQGRAVMDQQWVLNSHRRDEMSEESNQEDAIKGFYHTTLREVLGLAGNTKEEVDVLDMQLRQAKVER